MSIGADISQSIQQAIKAKLIELSSYVDDELPDYIMIMIANRKKEEQMTESLSLFLGNNTKVFTKWLYELLATLRGKKDDSAPKSSSSTSTTKQVDKKEKPTAVASITPVNEESNHLEIKKELEVPSKVEAQPTAISSAPAEAEIEILPDSGDVLDLELYGSNEMSANDSMLAEGPPEATQASSSAKESISSKTSNERTNNSKSNSENKEKVVTKRKIQIVATGSKSKPKTSADKDAKSFKLEKEKEKITHKSSSSNSRNLESVKSSSKHDDKQKGSSGREKTKKLKRSRSSKDDSQKRKHSSKQTREWDMVKESKGSWKESDNYEAQSKRQSSQQPRYNKNDKQEDDDDEPVVRKIASTVQSSVSTNREYISESEEENFSSSAVISKVSVPERRSRLPPTKQANKSLLLRAVSEAQTSMKRHKKSKDKSQKDTVKSVKSRLGKPKDRSPEITKPKKSKQNFEEDFEIHIEQPIKRTLKRKNIDSSVVIKKTKSLSKHPPSDDSHDDKTVQYKKTKQVKSLKSDLEPVSSTVEDNNLYTGDRRRFVSRSSLSDDAEDSRKQISVVRNASEVMDDSSVQFDRRNLHVTKSAEPSPNASVQSSDSEPVVPPRKRQSVKKQGKSTKRRSPSPCFIVTLDGTSSKSKNENQKPDSPSKVEQPQKKPFKAVPIVAPSSASSATIKGQKTNSVKPLTIKKDSIETSDDELTIMREKLLKMQEEARKLKTLQQEQLNILKQNPAASKIAAKPETSKSIHVANVHFSATEKKLSEYFGICGKVLRLTILKDQFTGHPKGFAYLEFEEQSSVETALALDNTMFCSRLIKVTRKSSAPSTPVKLAPTRFVARRPRSFGVHPRARYSARAALATFRPRYPATRGRNKTWVKPGFVAT